MKSLAILGRQPALGRAELESLYGSDNVVNLSENIVGLNLDTKDVEFSRLGGTIKLAKLLTVLSADNWAKIEKYLLKTTPEHINYLPEGKLQLGLSVYGLNVSINEIQKTGLKIKKVLKNKGRSVRLIPNKELSLNSAQVFHNKLTGPLGWELLVIKYDQEVILAQTTDIQDIEAYAARDQSRPKRDARVGMLPPKLAQIIINLANPPKNGAVLDPFCGTGVILQESQLVGCEAYGTDLDPRMVEYSGANISWLQDKFKPLGQSWRIEEADAVTYKWPYEFDVIATETYLGRPFSSEPTPDVLTEVMNDVNYIHKKFLLNVARQTRPGFRMCVAVPAWKTKNGFKHLKTLDNLADLGYTRLSFVHAQSNELIYHREDQIVGRELVVLIRK